MTLNLNFSKLNQLLSDLHLTYLLHKISFQSVIFRVIPFTDRQAAVNTVGLSLFPPQLALVTGFFARGSALGTISRHSYVTVTLKVHAAWRGLEMMGK